MIDLQIMKRGRRVVILAILPFFLGACKVVHNESASYSEGDSLAYQFSYRMHNGLDCGMVGDCGFVVELDRADTLRYWKSLASDSLIAVRRVSEVFRTNLTSALESGGFFDLPAEIPDPLSRRGMRTVTYEYQSHPDSQAVVKSAYLDETMFQFPEGFHRFDAEIRTLMLRELGVATDVSIEMPVKIIHD